MKGLTDIPGIAVGHASDYEGLTGCTVILCEKGAVAGVDVRGGATGTEELLVAEPGHVADLVHAVVFAGGSAFGLEAASGVRKFLEQKGVGFETQVARVPIVPAAILFDLAIGKASARPTREMGEAAAAAASTGPVQEGAVGAGTGATVGKMLGMKCAMKSGVGSATVWLGGPNEGVAVAALAAVNAFGDVREPSTGKIVAGARRAPDSREWLDMERHLVGAGRERSQPWNTTLVCVATNAAFSRVQTSRLAQMAQVGLARTISPVHTMFDGDLVFAFSFGDRKADLTAVGVAAVQAVEQAILRAVRMAPSLGGVPGLKAG